MNLLQSISHPELLVSDSGQVYNKTSGQRINLLKTHGYSTRGYVIAYRYNGKSKNVSVLNLVYEAHVKKAKLTSSDYVEVIDGDDYNCNASNLQCIRGRSARKKPTRIHKIASEETYATWMGIDELYC